MKKAGSQDFISILSEEKPPLILFRYKEETPQFSKLLKDLLKDYPLMNAYEYIIDENEKNQMLAEHLQFVVTPILVFYKNGSFNRYKDKNFSKKNLTLFLGSKKTYNENKTKSENLV